MGLGTSGPLAVFLLGVGGIAVHRDYTGNSSLFLVVVEAMGIKLVAVDMLDFPI